jgi:hypothetical protein
MERELTGAERDQANPQIKHSRIDGTFVRLKVKGEGERARAVWAVKLASKGKLLHYVRVDEHGEEYHDARNKAGKRVSEKEIMLVAPDCVVYEKPAYYSLFYGELVLLEDRPTCCP